MPPKRFWVLKFSFVKENEELSHNMKECKGSFWKENLLGKFKS